MGMHHSCAFQKIKILGVNIKLGTWICIDMFVHNDCGSVVGVLQTDSEKPQHDTSVCLC